MMASRTVICLTGVTLCPKRWPLSLPSPPDVQLSGHGWTELDHTVGVSLETTTPNDFFISISAKANVRKTSTYRCCHRARPGNHTGCHSHTLVTPTTELPGYAWRPKRAFTTFTRQNVWALIVQQEQKTLNSYSNKIVWNHLPVAMGQAGSVTRSGRSEPLSTQTT